MAGVQEVVIIIFRLLFSDEREKTGKETRPSAFSQINLNFMGAEAHKFTAGKICLTNDFPQTFFPFFPLSSLAKCLNHSVALYVFFVEGKGSFPLACEPP